MEKVLGFGGFFFRAKDPEALAQWYRDHLGISLVPQSPKGHPWQAKGGPTVFALTRLEEIIVIYLKWNRN